MALTNTAAAGLGKQPSAPLFALAVNIAFDSSYPTGGEPFDADAVARSLLNQDKTPTVHAVLIEKKDGFSFEYDRTNKKILAYVAAGTEVADTTDLSTSPGTVHAVLLFE